MLSESRISPPRVVLSFPASSVIGVVEDVIATSATEAPGLAEIPIELDLSRCEFVDVPALAHLIAFIADREKRNVPTAIRLPVLKAVRDFLRVWSFPEGVRLATGRPFIQLVREEDHHYFGENREPATLKYAGRFLSEHLEHLLSTRFFAFQTTLLRQIPSRTRWVVDESAKWKEQQIRSVFRRHLKGPDGQVSSHILCELLTNSLRHPDASVLQVVSQFCAPPDTPEQGVFTIVTWDNGIGMMDTLRAALREQKPIRTETSPDLECLFDVTIHELGTKRREDSISSTFTPDAATQDWLLLLSTFFPGVTRDVQGIDSYVHADVKAGNPKLAQPGMGLYVLLDAVVGVFNGTLSVRTGDFFLNIQRARKQATSAAGHDSKPPTHSRYRVKVQRRAKPTPRFYGNMLTVRIPVHP